MVTRVGGQRRRTRRTFSKEPRRRGKVNISSFFQEFKPGDKVCLQFESSVATGRYFHRFHGNTGVIGKKQGDCYEVIVRVSKNHKPIFVHPVHLKRLK